MSGQAMNGQLYYTCDSQRIDKDIYFGWSKETPGSKANPSHAEAFVQSSLLCLAWLETKKSPHYKWVGTVIGGLEKVPIKVRVRLVEGRPIPKQEWKDKTRRWLKKQRKHNKLRFVWSSVEKKTYLGASLLIQSSTAFFPSSPHSPSPVYCCVLSCVHRKQRDCPKKRYAPKSKRAMCLGRDNSCHT